MVIITAWLLAPPTEAIPPSINTMAATVAPGAAGAGVRAGIR
jgi:hypothetical protein